MFRIPGLPRSVCRVDMALWYRFGMGREDFELAAVCGQHLNTLGTFHDAKLELGTYLPT
jgi:hypothetical protein